MDGFQERFWDKKHFWVDFKAVWYSIQYYSFYFLVFFFNLQTP